MAKKIRLILVDDNITFLEGLKSMFKDKEKFEILDTYNSGIDLLRSEEFNKADLILLDIEMPELNGIETARRINFLSPNTKLIAITMYQDIVYLQQLIEVGFKGFVNKTQVGEKLFPAIESVLNNRFLFPKDIELK